MVYWFTEGSDNGYSTSFENWRPQGHVGSNPTPSALDIVYS